MNPDPTQNFQIILIQGASWVQTFTWYDVSGNPIDLTGYSALMVFRSTVEDTGTPIISVSTSGGIIISSSTMTVTIPSSVTATLTNGQTLVYSLFLTSPSNIVTSLLAGHSIVQGSTI